MSDVDDISPKLRSREMDKSFDLEKETIIGRHIDCDIVLNNEAGASRRHARFCVRDGDVFLADLGSTNGTLVNGDKIDKEVKLSDGDRLIFDELEYEVDIPSQRQEPSPDNAVTEFIDRDELKKRMLDQQSFDIPVDSQARSESSKKADKNPIEPLQQKNRANKDDIAPGFSSAPEPEFAPRPNEARKPETAQLPEVKPRPQPPNDKPVEPERAAYPPSWVESGNVQNSNRTILAPSIATSTTWATEIDFSSISEPTLAVRTGNNNTTYMPLTSNKDKWSIGSGANCDVHINHKGVSENHAAIMRVGKKWKVVDQMSKNNTFVNGHQCNVRFIDNRDSLRFGPVTCQFIVPANYKASGGSNKRSTKKTAITKTVFLLLFLTLLVAGVFLAYNNGMLQPITDALTTTDPESN